MTRSDAACIFLFDPDRNTFTLRASYNMSLEYIQEVGERPMPPDTYPPIQAAQGQVSTAAAGLAGAAVGALVGAGWMAAGFFCSELEALCKDVDPSLRLGKEARGKDTAPMEHLQAPASVLNDINEHSAQVHRSLRNLEAMRRLGQEPCDGLFLFNADDRIRRAGHAVQDRNELLTGLRDEARPGDCVLLMGARDPSLPALARKIVEVLGGEASAA